MVLFERCLIHCALYEQFWAKYVRYLERAHKEGKDRDEMGRVGLDMAEGDDGKARDAFNTGLGVVDEMREARFTWTLRGSRETLKDGTQLMRAEEDLEQGLEDGNGESKDKEKAVDTSELLEESINNGESEENQLTESDMVTEGNMENGIEEVHENVEDTVVEDGEVDRLSTPKPGESSSSSAVKAEMSRVVVVVSDQW